MSARNLELCSWSSRDLMFVVQSLIPDRGDPGHVADLLREDDQLLEAMLEDERLLHRLVDDDSGFYSVSPRFFFKVLLVQLRNDLVSRLPAIRARPSQRVVLADAQNTVSFLTLPETSNYLAAMLASFTRSRCRKIPVQVRQGVWRKIRVNDLDVDSLLLYAQTLDEAERFSTYQRIADSCLFITGMLAECIETRPCLPQPADPQLRLNSALVHSFEDHENLGRSFYRLAARHENASHLGLSDVLSTMSESFSLAERALTLLSRRYLGRRKHKVFGL